MDGENQHSERPRGRSSRRQTEPAAAPTQEMREKADAIRAAFGQGNRGVLEAGKMLAEYQAELANQRAFQKFWKGTLAWPKTRVYRLIDAYRDFGHLPDQTLGMFDLSALYTLSGEGQEQGRTKAVKEAEGGRFITNTVANGLLGRADKSGTTPGTIRVSRQKLTAEAKKLALDPKKVIELLEHLGVTLDWTGKKPDKGVKATKTRRKGKAA